MTLSGTHKLPLSAYTHTLNRWDRTGPCCVIVSSLLLIIKPFVNWKRRHEKWKLLHLNLSNIYLPGDKKFYWETKNRSVQNALTLIQVHLVRNGLWARLLRNAGIFIGSELRQYLLTSLILLIYMKNLLCKSLFEKKFGFG